MVVEQHRSVGGEHFDELGLGQGMRVLGLFDEDHQIRHVHDADAQSRDELAEERRGGDDFECDFYTDTDKDNVGVDTFVGGAELPDRRAGDTMLE